MIRSISIFFTLVSDMQPVPYKSTYCLTKPVCMPLQIADKILLLYIYNILIKPCAGGRPRAPVLLLFDSDNYSTSTLYMTEKKRKKTKKNREVYFSVFYGPVDHPKLLSKRSMNKVLQD
jgi:hypothetical protein